MKRVLMFALCAILLVGCSSANDSEQQAGNGTEGNGEEVQETSPIVSDQEAEIIESKFFYGGNSSQFYVELKNPNTEQWIAQPKIKVTAYDENGNVLASEDKTVMFMAQEQTVKIAGMMFTDDREPADVQFSVVGSSDIAKPTKAHTIELEVKNTNELTDEYGIYRVLGEIENLSDSDVNIFNQEVTLVLKQGSEVVYAMSTYVDDLTAGATTTFEFVDHDVPDHDTYEVYAYAWDNGQ